MWHSGLRIWPCHCSGSGCCCGLSSVPGPGTSACCGCGQNKNKLLTKAHYFHHLTPEHPLRGTAEGLGAGRALCQHFWQVTRAVGSTAAAAGAWPLHAALRMPGPRRRHEAAAGPPRARRPRGLCLDPFYRFSLYGWFPSRMLLSLVLS